MSHTILFLQPAVDMDSRTYCDFESVEECLQCICQIYEEHLKRHTPDASNITYDICQLFNFLDNLQDISCLVYQLSTNTYAPYNKDWIKDKICSLLRHEVVGVDS